jgi:hypothetical protein
MTALLHVMMFRAEVALPAELRELGPPRVKTAMVESLLFDQFLSELLRFVRGFGASIEVRDAECTLTNGMKLLASAFSQNTDVPGSEPRTSFREIVFQVLTVLQMRLFDADEDLLQQCLELVRGMIFLENPICDEIANGGKNKDGNDKDATSRSSTVLMARTQWEEFAWDMFREGTALCKKLPSTMLPYCPANLEGLYDEDRVISWVQWKYSDLGATICGLNFVNSKSATVQQAALALLNNLLENGNQRVQATVEMWFVAQSTSGQIFASFHEIIEQSKQSIERHRKVLKKRKVAHAQHRIGKASVSDESKRTLLQALKQKRKVSVSTSHAGSLSDMYLRKRDSIIMRTGPKDDSLARKRTTIVQTQMYSTAGDLLLDPSNDRDAGDDKQSREEDVSSQMILSSLANLLELMRLLRWFAEGHNAGLQNYIRHQPNIGTSFDLVSGTVDLLEVLQPLVAQTFEEEQISPKLSEKMVTVMTTVLETLAELVQGPCRANQAAIISANFFTILNRFMATYKFDHSISLNDWALSSNMTKLDIKVHLLNLTVSVVESQPDSALLGEICETLNFELLIEELNEIWKLLAECKSCRTPDRALLTEMSQARAHIIGCTRTVTCTDTYAHVAGRARGDTLDARLHRNAC